MLFARFLLPLTLCLGLLTLLLLPWAEKLVESWITADLELRSRLIFTSIEDDLSTILENERAARLDQSFTRMARDERVGGLAYCEKTGKPRSQSKNFPAGILCTNEKIADNGTFERRTIGDGTFMLARFAAPRPEQAGMQAAETTGVFTPYIMIVHNLAYAVQRSEKTKTYILWSILAISFVAGVITLIVARFTLSGWLASLRQYLRTGEKGPGITREMLVLAREIQHRVRQIEREYSRQSLSGAMWSAATLSAFVRNSLPSEQLIAVSCREPYSHMHTDKGITCTTPASGLVTALEPIMKACNGTWVAVATGDADKEVVDAHDRIAVPPDQPTYSLKRLWLSAEESAGFYLGFANEGIWPLCNIAYVKPRFRASDWAMYKQVNQKFADAIVQEAKTSSPIVFIQDYHFGLLPKLVREKLPNALIVLFWHTPWPNSEVFGILPYKREFLSGILAADIIGFHTQFNCNNFLDCVDSYIEALIDREHDTVRHGNDLCLVEPYPISISWPEKSPDHLTAAECRKKLGRDLGLAPDVKILVGVERLDYIKGITERLSAYRLFLENEPSWHGKVCFVQVASPSRSDIQAYADLDREIEEATREINEAFGNNKWQPVILYRRNFTPREVRHIYRAADVCVVSSLHDGMNLVAKEFVAARDDELGVLVLSQFAGASRELIDALIVNPYDEEGLSQTFLQALTMDEGEQAARMKSMRDYVREHNVFGWAGEILRDAARLFNRRQLNTMLREMYPTQNLLTGETGQNGKKQKDKIA
ncbi:MAG: trehalose-6-phosphate synthase [Alphaproteobacteria bacterium]|nr:trehalose-6-phosphate synthase [Alphaproteobacteria bacterium]